jgi:hypothetical protein
MLSSVIVKYNQVFCWLLYLNDIVGDVACMLIVRIIMPKQTNKQQQPPSKTEVLRMSLNWKAPGKDQKANFWLKQLTAT